MGIFNDILTGVIENTNRPDLVSLAKQGILRAVNYYHSLEDWQHKDSHTQYGGFEGEDLCCCIDDNGHFRYSSCSGVPIKNIIGELYADDVLIPKLENCNPLECFYYLRDGYLYINCPSCLGDECPEVCFKTPKPISIDLANCNLSSWIAEKHPEIIITYAAEYVNSQIERRVPSYREEDSEMLIRNYLYDPSKL